LGGELVAGVEGRGVGAEGEGEADGFFGCGFAWGDGVRGEDELVEGELLDLIEAGAGEDGGGVSGVEGEGGECGRLGEGFGGNGVGLGLAELPDDEVGVAGGQGLERDFEVDVVGLVGLLPLGVALGAAEGFSVKFERYGVDAGGSGRAEGEVVVIAGDEDGVRIRVGGELPVGAGGLLEAEGGAVERVEAPVAGDGSGDGACVGGDRLWGWDGGRGGGGGSGGWFRYEGEKFAGFDGGKDEAALKGVGDEGDIFGGFSSVDVEDEVVGEGGGEDEGRAFYGKDDRGLEEAGDELGVCLAKGWGDGGLDGGEAYDDDGFGIVEGGGGVEAEVEGDVLGEGDGGDVLVVRGVETTHEAGKIDDGSDVGTVDTASGELGVAGGGDEIGTGAGGESGDDGLAVAVVEEGLVAGLGEAVVLEVNGTFEAFFVGAEVEGAGEEIGVVEEGPGVGGWHLAHGGEVHLDAGLLEAGLSEILRGADEDSGTSADGGAEGGEVAAGFRGEEEDGLLGFVGDGDFDAFVTDGLGPGGDFDEPVIGGWVGGATQEDGYEEVVDGLGWREVGVEPKLVAGLEIRYGSDGQGFAAAGDADFDLGTRKVESGGGLGGQSAGEREQRSK